MTSSRDISAQTTALLLSAVSIALARRTKSLTLLPVAPVRWTSWARSSSLRSQALSLPSPPCTLAPRLLLTAKPHTITYYSCSLYPYRTGKLYFSTGKKIIAIIKNVMKKHTLIRYIQPPKFTASPSVIAGIEENSPVDFF